MPVLINGRSAVHKGSKGTLTTQDPCYTGPNRQVVVYQNIAKSEDAENGASRILVNGHPMCHKESYFSKSTGDEAGDGGGVKSGTTRGKAEFITASSKVRVNGIHAVRAGDLMVSNNRNTQPAQLQQKSPPFNADKQKIDKFLNRAYPKAEIDLGDLHAVVSKTELRIQLPQYIYIAHIRASLTGNLILQKEGACNPITLNLKSYKIDAKQQLGDFISNLKVQHYGDGKLEIGTSITGYYWSTYVAVRPLVVKGTAYPKPVSKIFNGWKVEGNLGFTLEIEYEPLFGKVLPLARYVSNHAPYFIGLGRVI